MTRFSLKKLEKTTTKILKIYKAMFEILTKKDF